LFAAATADVDAGVACVACDSSAHVLGNNVVKFIGRRTFALLGRLDRNDFHRFELWGGDKGLDEAKKAAQTLHVWSSSLDADSEN
jgi:hypothetical protein